MTEVKDGLKCTFSAYSPTTACIAILWTFNYKVQKTKTDVESFKHSHWHPINNFWRIYIFKILYKYLSLTKHMTDFMSCSEATETVCFGGSQIQMWTWTWLGPEVPDRFGGQKHYSELTPATRITASESKYHTGQTEVWWI